MITEQRLLKAVIHVVHDYANLVSSGTMTISGTHSNKVLEPPVNTHVCHAFLVNCRKMFEFFTYQPSMKTIQDDIKAKHFLESNIVFDLSNWALWHKPMNKQLLHITFTRVTRPKVWDGTDENRLFLAEFQNAWKLFLSKIKEPYLSKFENEISAKLKSEFRGLNLR